MSSVLSAIKTLWSSRTRLKLALTFVTFASSNSHVARAATEDDNVLNPATVPYDTRGLIPAEIIDRNLVWQEQSPDTGEVGTNALPTLAGWLSG